MVKVARNQGSSEVRQVADLALGLIQRQKGDRVRFG